ncbi:glycerophosphodiester phosphodiesterase [Thermoactinomyces mirandus]|uniref:Glycerophosphodiester phosphodiesterase n=1 Tax=Thermoactinomyces mirandus TaxID=2756294 RepID=A0A7W1XQ32_9BACL|nr:glycerophosphodiester phosphodiesterase [Thermoactinomyces mirandus]MBA4601198.1 glycerophosphodiester phosphodiesterase [Thermoactinomyces mirandus]
MSQTKVFAHRGFSGIAPENTMAAFEKALEAQADGIELDVHLSRDGELIVMHDEKVDRTTNGSGWIKDLTLAELKQLDNGSWFGKDYENETVPTLAEVLELVGDSDLAVNIELKNTIIPYPGLEQKVIREVERFQMQDRVILSSFRHDSLQLVKKICPAMQVGALYACGMVDPWVYAGYLGVDAIHPHYLAATEEIVAGCHRHGIRVRPYTVNEEEDMKCLISAGADAIITNYPDRLRRLLPGDGK